MDEIVFIIDDDISIRRSLSDLLGAYDYLTETYPGSEEYLAREPHKGTGCIILDINMEGRSGLELQDELLNFDSSLPIIFITSVGNIHLSVQTIRKGAVNFLEKPFKEEELLSSISEAIELSRELAGNQDEIKRAKDLINTLTPRETEILKYLITGMLNKQIASELNIAERTVKIHRHNLSEKLMVKSVPEIIRIADRAGIIPFENKY